MGTREKTVLRESNCTYTRLRNEATADVIDVGLPW